MEPLENREQNREQSAPDGVVLEREAAQRSPGTTETRASPGALIGVIIIIIVLVIGGLYFWGAQLNKSADERNREVRPPSVQSRGDAATPSPQEAPRAPIQR